MTAPAPVILSALYVYPLKAARGVSLPRAGLEPRGLSADRRWMVVAPDGRPITQREFPEMSTVQVQLRPAGDARHALLLEAPGLPPLPVPRVPEGPAVRARVWDDDTVGVVVSRAASAWFSRFLVPGCELLYMPDDAQRAQRGKPFSSLLSFADGNPFHLVGEASVADLNTRLARPVDAGRFRPNLVVRGAAPYDEDYWRRLSVGPQEFLVVESCARCSVLNVVTDPHGQGARHSAEPLRTLARTRRRGQAVVFGQHLLQGPALYRPGGHLEVGWPVHVLERADDPNPTY